MLRPYIYRAEIDAVSVFLVVGFRERPDTPSDEESDTRPKYSSEDAGWTIVCNDRVILPYDKGRQTGWGWGGVPSYHNQFIWITGFVFFDGYPSDLPMTTTKRGVNANLDVYTIVRERMQTGVKHFTRFTNDWKGFDVSEIFKKAERITVPEIERLVEKRKIKLHALRGYGQQEQTAPELPPSPREVTERAHLLHEGDQRYPKGFKVAFSKRGCSPFRRWTRMFRFRAPKDKVVRDEYWRTIAIPTSS